jgi:hypothetical protein
MVYMLITFNLFYSPIVSQLHTICYDQKMIEMGVYSLLNGEALSIE